MPLIFLWVILMGSCLPSVDVDKYEQQNGHPKIITKAEAKKTMWPRLLSHDLGYGKEIKIAANRIFFRLTFDQPLALGSGDAIDVISREEKGASIPIKSAKFSDDKTTMVLSLVPQKGGPFLPQKRYAVTIRTKSGSAPGAHEHIVLAEFTAMEPAPELKANMPIKISALSNGVQIKWQLNHAHQTRFLFGTSPNKLDCLARACPEIMSLPKEKRALSSENLSLITVAGLLSETKYYFSIKSMDRQGQELAILGDFLTTASSDLRISEVMIRPKMPKGVPEHRGEFIELKNIGSEPINLGGFMLGLESLWESEGEKCPLEFGEREIPGGSYVLIVGKEFDPALYSLPSATLILRMPNKTMCGGLANSYPQLIKIYGPSGDIQDGYRAHLWPDEAGVSVARINVAGLDEPDNYCYSGQGSSPGVANGTPKACAPQKN